MMRFFSTSHREERLQQLHPRGLALLRMELRGDDVVTRHQSAERTTVLTHPRSGPVRWRIERERMVEVEVRTLAGLELAERFGEFHGIPSHVRNSQGGVRGFLESRHGAAYPTEAFVPTLLLAVIRHQLHADADTEQWLLVLERPALYGGQQA